MSTTTPTDTDKKSIVEKLLTPNSKPTMESFPELPDCIIWLRFVMALCYVSWLILSPSGGRRGGANLLLGLNFVTFVPVIYCQWYLGADSVSYGNSLLFGGVVQSLAAVLLIWAYFYTESHPEDVAIFASAMGKAMAGSVSQEFGAAGDATDDPSSPLAGGLQDPPMKEDSEF